MTSERKVMLMLHTLHKRGFEKLRFSAGISPSGLHWRYEIAPAQSFNPDGATVKHELYARGAFASSNGKSAPFDWREAETATLEEFAEWFVEHLPEVAEGGRGADTAYAAWYKHALELTAPEGLLVMYGEYHDLARDGISVRGMGRRVEVPLPPAP
jgi:hypothetical protein